MRPLEKPQAASAAPLRRWPAAGPGAQEWQRRRLSPTRGSGRGGNVVCRPRAPASRAEYKRVSLELREGNRCLWACLPLFVFLSPVLPLIQLFKYAATLTTSQASKLYTEVCTQRDALTPLSLYPVPPPLGGIPPQCFPICLWCVCVGFSVFRFSKFNRYFCFLIPCCLLCQSILFTIVRTLRFSFTVFWKSDHSFPPFCFFKYSIVLQPNVIVYLTDLPCLGT